jgi:hypothetical protein
MGKYFMRGTEVPEPRAAECWFSYAEKHEIEISKAISIWEDAATAEGDTSRRAVGDAGIHIDPAAR